jgi:hypothetical protein
MEETVTFIPPEQFHLTSYWMVVHTSFDVVSTAKAVLHRRLGEEDLIVRILNVKNRSVFRHQPVGRKEDHGKCRRINDPAA